VIWWLERAEVGPKGGIEEDEGAMNSGGLLESTLGMSNKRTEQLEEMETLVKSKQISAALAEEEPGRHSSGITHHTICFVKAKSEEKFQL